MGWEKVQVVYIYVDMGTEVEDGSLPVATEALVLMLLSIDSSWKIPIGYFFLVGMTWKERAAMVINM